MADRMTLRLATRGSRLALVQTESIAALLREHHPELRIELVTVATRGDRQQDVPLAEMQSPDGVFTRAIEEEVLRGQADVAVHSLKDEPTLTDSRLAFAAFPVRADARDVLVGRHSGTFDRLPVGATIGTSSPRRTAQVLEQRPDLRPVPIRGNVDTRLRKLEAGEVDALILAAAGLERLGLLRRASEVLPVDRFTPAVGQGALVAQCRADDRATRELLAPLDDPRTRVAVTAERAFLRAVGGGCRVPVAGYAEVAEGQLVLRGFIAAPDGGQARREVMRGRITEPEALGAALAERLLAVAGPIFLAGVRGG